MWALTRKFLIIVAGIIVMSSVTQAAESSDIKMLDLLLSGKPAEASLFTTQFLNAVPLDQVNTILEKISGEIGAPTKIAANGQEYEITTLTHTMSATITLNEAGKIAGLFFRPPVLLNAQLPELLQPFDQIAGKTSYLILQGDIVLAQKDADKPLAIGSAFKLAILKVLQNEIETGNRQWDDVIRLSRDLRSLPSGILQNFPDNSPITLHTLAALMISASDNTAADTLLNLLGREKVSAYLDNKFVLSTREFFQLKDNPKMAKTFANGDRNAKQKISEQLKARPLPSTNVGVVPYRPGVEWYLSAKALCTLVKSVRNSDVFEINPGLARRDKWAHIAFKGGSELGVLNLTTWVQAKDGKQYCLAFTANNTLALPETKITNAYAALLEHLANLNQ